MIEKLKNSGNLPLIIILAIVIVVAIVLSIVKAQKSEETDASTNISEATKQEQIEEEQEIQDEEIIDAEVPEEEEEPQQAVNIDAKYFIRVNYGQNVVTIYTKDSNGEYTVPYKAMVCSTGTATPTSGTYTMPSSGSKSTRGIWGMMIGNVWAQYYTRIKGSILFHSVPYTEKNKWSLEYWEYDKLGTAASAGCVRLTVEDAKWIYNNCPAGTKVEFYSDSNPGPLGKPTAQKISEEEAVRGWDPTDPDETNPWKKYILDQEEPEENNTTTKPATKPAAKPTIPTTPQETPGEDTQNPNEGGTSGEETPNPDEGGTPGEEIPNPDEGGTSGEEIPTPDEGGTPEEEAPNPDESGTPGEEETPNPDESGIPGEEETPNPNEGESSEQDQSI